jgi:hypothetical protein
VYLTEYIRGFVSELYDNKYDPIRDILFRALMMLSQNLNATSMYLLVFAPPPLKKDFPLILYNIFKESSEYFRKITAGIGNNHFIENIKILLHININVIADKVISSSLINDRIIAVIAGAPFGVSEGATGITQIKEMIQTLSFPAEVSSQLTGPIIALFHSLIRAPIATALEEAKQYALHNPLPAASLPPPPPPPQPPQPPSPESSSPAPPSFDDTTTYQGGDKITWTDGKVYQFNKFIGAPGYHPGNHPDTWTLITSGGYRRKSRKSKKSKKSKKTQRR